MRVNSCKHLWIKGCSFDCILYYYNMEDLISIMVEKTEEQSIIRKHPFVFLISFPVLLYVLYVIVPNLFPYLPYFYLYMSNPVVAIIFIVSGLAVLFLLSWILTAIWAGMTGENGWLGRDKSY